jgi:hypothetical protein
MILKGSIKWQFKVSFLLPLAEKYAKYHREREAFYREEYDKAEQNLRTSGIVMMEQAKILASGSITGYGYGGLCATPQIDPKYTKAVNKARAKIEEHKNMAEEFVSYVNVFRSILSQEYGETASFFLDVGDMEFFHLGEEF